MASRKRAYLNDITLAFVEDMRAVHAGLMDEAAASLTPSGSRPA